MDDFVEEARRSLLDVVLEKIQRAGKQVVVSRLVYVAAVEGKQLTSKADVQVCAQPKPLYQPQRHLFSHGRQTEPLSEWLM
jgi:hypothetical protein